LAKKYGDHAEITREEFLEHGLHAATGYNITFAGTASQLADRMEEIFEATGSRGGFMLAISQAASRQVLQNTVNYLVPELQRRERYRTSYEGKTLRENMSA
jgi:alkanesulfonate monooxygenase SsuD/methylene tetrahydromethanopterin reductase-like flavin-dependent oxidoreductase (luciferase family)